MKNKATTFLMAALLMTAIGCEKNPIDKLVNPNPDGALSQHGNSFLIYGDELMTSGGFGFIPGGENQTLSTRDFSSPKNGSNQIKYAWNGQDVSNGGTPEHLFAGYAFTITPDFSTFNSVGPKDISGPGYTKVKFLIRGSLDSETYVRIEGPDDGNSGTAASCIESANTAPNIVCTHTAPDFTLTSDWQEITLPVPNPAQFQFVKTYLTISLQFTQPAGTTNAGTGGVIYLDDVRYEK